MTEPVQFDPFSDDYFNDPSDVYRRLRDEAPVYFSEKYGFYALSRFADVLAAHRDWETYSSAHGIDLSTLSKDSGADPELQEHHHDGSARARPAAGAREPRVHAEGRDRARADDPRGHLSASSSRSRTRPSSTRSPTSPRTSPSRSSPACSACRKPTASRFRKRLDISLHREHGQLDMSDENMAAVVETGAYFYELAVEKRKNPGDDMMSRLTQVTVDRGDGTETGLDDIEITGFAGLLGGAGAETVTKLVGNAVVLFGRHPEQWQKILDDPEKIPRAVEEILRILPPSQYQGRFSHAAPRLRRRHAPGRLPGAPHHRCRDARSAGVREPDDFDIERVPGISIGFGHGVHSCLGAALGADGEPHRARRARQALALGSRSTTPVCNGCTCRTSRATRTCRCASAADQRKSERRSPTRSFYDQRVSIESENGVSERL